MRIFVAGASGAIGRPLVRRLLEAGHEVAGGASSDSGLAGVRAEGAEAVACDLLDAASVRAALAQAGPEVVVNQATRIPSALKPRMLRRQFAQTDRLRTEGTRNLVDAARAAGARRLVSQSIVFAYRHDGPSPKTEDEPLWHDAPPDYRRTVEAVAELERRTLGTDGLEGVVLRYGLFYGPGTWFAPGGSIHAMVRARRYPIVGEGGGVSSFLHVEDAAAATQAALERAGAGSTFNVADDDPAPLREWLPAYADAIGAPPPRRVPLALARIGAGPYVRSQLTRQRAASNARAKEELGWQPRWRSWREGFREALG